MDERKVFGVQGLARHRHGGQGCREGATMRRGVGVGVERIADHGMSNAGEMGANLMRPSCLQRATQQACVVAEGLFAAIVGDGEASFALSTVSADCHARALHGVASERCFDRVCEERRHAPHEREVTAFKVVACEHFAKRVFCLLCFCSDHDAAGLFVEPMDDAATRVLRVAREVGGAVGFQAIDQCFACNGGGGVGGQVGGFDEAEQMLVFVEDLQRRFFFCLVGVGDRGAFGVCWVGDGDRDLLSVVEG